MHENLLCVDAAYLSKIKVTTTISTHLEFAQVHTIKASINTVKDSLSPKEQQNTTCYYYSARHNSRQNHTKTHFPIYN